MNRFFCDKLRLRDDETVFAHGHLSIDETNHSSRAVTIAQTVSLESTRRKHVLEVALT
jgi:hypothetical protein